MSDKPEETIEIIHAEGVAPLTIRTRKISDEPRERTGTIRDEAIRQLNDLDARERKKRAEFNAATDRIWTLLNPENAPILAAVLAEVARRNAGEPSSYDEGCSEYELAVVNAAFYVREAMRLKSIHTQE